MLKICTFNKCIFYKRRIEYNAECRYPINDSITVFRLYFQPIILQDSILNNVRWKRCCGTNFLPNLLPSKQIQICAPFSSTLHCTKTIRKQWFLSTRHWRGNTIITLKYYRS